MENNRHINPYVSRNQKAAIAYRNAYFQEGRQELDAIIQHITEAEQVGWDKFADQFERLLFYLAEARYYGRWSIGWDVTKAKGLYDIREISIVDHIETFYSHVRSIRRLIRHEMAVMESRETLQKGGEALSAYGDQLIATDEDSVLAVLKTLQDRVRLFTKVFHDINHHSDVVSEIRVKAVPY